MVPVHPAQEVVQPAAEEQQHTELGPFETMDEQVEEHDRRDLQRHDDRGNREVRSPEDGHDEQE